MFHDPTAAESWARAENATANLYIQANPTIGNIAKKATKSQIAAMEFFHVDIDGIDGADEARERTRILSLLTVSRPSGVPAPTLIVFSGGGYQAWWRLAEPIAIDGDTSKAEEAERWNRALEALFGADHCHDCSRLLRLPHTKNWPNKKKLAKGRVPTDSDVFAWPDGADAYPLSAFKFAPAPMKGAVFSTSQTVATLSHPQIPPARVSAIPLAAGTEELQRWAESAGTSIDPLTLAYVATGTHAIEPDRHHGNRSDAVFAATCGLVRAGVPDDLIVRVLTDPSNAISAHVLDQRGDKAVYAQRQATRARELLQAERDVPSWDRVNKEGEPSATRHNTKVAIQRLGIVCRQDVFKRSTLVEAHQLQQHVGALTDDVELVVEEAIHRAFGFYPSDGHTAKAIQALAIENRFDSLIDHLNGLPSWDGTPRLDTWLPAYCATEDTAYTRAAGAAWLTAAIVRAFEPGAKFDYMLVLQGGQGVGKSTAFRLLAGDDFFSDAAFLGAKGAREILEVSNGCWILECAELDGMSRRDITEIKADISKQADSGRPAYARNPVTVLRRFVLAGTTNERRFLQDVTGNRRFWPVTVGRIDLQRLRIDRHQLVAEALARYRSGTYALTLNGEAAAGAEAAQGLRLVVDEGYAERLEHLGSQVRKLRDQWIVTNDDVYERLGIPPKDRNGVVPRKVKEAMRSLGWHACAKPMRIEGVTQRYYLWTNEEPPEGRSSADRPPF